MLERENILEYKSDSGSPDSPEKTKEQIKLEGQIDRLRDLEGIFARMDLIFHYKNSDSDLVETKGIEKTQAAKVVDLIRKGHEGKFKGLDKKDDILHAIATGTITEQDLTARINNINNDLINLEEQLQLAKSEDDVINLTQTVVDKYSTQDWPE